MINERQVLAGLRNEINETLHFMVSTDISIYGYVTEETKSCFETQKVEFPKVLEDLSK